MTNAVSDMGLQDFAFWGVGEVVESALSRKLRGGLRSKATNSRSAIAHAHAHR